MKKRSAGILLAIFLLTGAVSMAEELPEEILPASDGSILEIQCEMEYGVSALEAETILNTTDSGDADTFVSPEEASAALPDAAEDAAMAEAESADETSATQWAAEAPQYETAPVPEAAYAGTGAAQAAAGETAVSSGETETTAQEDLISETPVQDPYLQDIPGENPSAQETALWQTETEDGISTGSLATDTPDTPVAEEAPVQEAAPAVLVVEDTVSEASPGHTAPQITVSGTLDPQTGIWHVQGNRDEITWSWDGREQAVYDFTVISSQSETLLHAQTAEPFLTVWLSSSASSVWFPVNEPCSVILTARYPDGLSTVSLCSFILESTGLSDTEGIQEEAAQEIPEEPAGTDTLHSQADTASVPAQDSTGADTSETAFSAAGTSAGSGKKAKSTSSGRKNADTQEDSGEDAEESTSDESGEEDTVPDTSSDSASASSSGNAGSKASKKTSKGTAKGSSKPASAGTKKAADTSSQSSSSGAKKPGSASDTAAEQETSEEESPAIGKLEAGTASSILVLTAGDVPLDLSLNGGSDTFTAKVHDGTLTLKPDEVGTFVTTVMEDALAISLNTDPAVWQFSLSDLSLLRACGIRQLEITSGARVYTIPLSESGADTLQEDTAEEEVLTFPLILLPEDLPVIWVLDETSLTVQMDTENLVCIL